MLMVLLDDDSEANKIGNWQEWMLYLSLVDDDEIMTII